MTLDIRRVAVLVAAAALITAVLGPASAGDAVIAVAAPFRYSPEPIELARGDTLTFVNLDPVSGEGHSLTHAVPPGGEQFKTPIIPPGSTAPVEGIPDLAPGSYRFTCRVHAFMRGVLVVK